MLDVLSALPVAADLDPGDRAKLAAIARLEQHPAGARLFVEGEAADGVYLLVDGRVALGLRVAGAPDATVLTVGPGELVGWSALTGEARVTTARALDPIRVIFLPRPELLALCDADHDIGYAVMRLALVEVARRLQDTRMQLLDVYRAHR